MYIRWQTRSHRAIILVENVRVDGRPRKKYVAYLAGFDEQQVSGHP
jgi:ribosomal protein S4E